MIYFIFKVLGNYNNQIFFTENVKNIDLEVCENLELLSNILMRYFGDVWLYFTAQQSDKLYMLKTKV